MKFLHKEKLPEAWARCEWCRMHLGKSIKYSTWWRHRGYLYFKDEKMHLMYLLKWS